MLNEKGVSAAHYKVELQSFKNEKDPKSVSALPISRIPFNEVPLTKLHSIPTILDENMTTLQNRSQSGPLQLDDSNETSRDLSTYL